MRIGASLTSAHPSVDGREGARRMIERTRAARDAGLWCLTVGDHHANRRPYFQNTPILGRLLAEWGDDRPAGCLFLVPLWNPVLMAEQIGTLATLAGEPFIVQTGIGQPADRAAMGTDGRRRGRLLDETIAVVDALLAGDRVDSAFFGLTGATVAPVPPGPIEWWIGASSDAGIDRAARVGDCWYAEPGLTVHTAAERMAFYLDRCSYHRRTPVRVPLRRDVLVAETDAEASRLVAPLLAAGYRGIDPEALAFGSPSTVAERLAAFGPLGFTDIIVRQMAVDHDAVLRSYALLNDVAERLEDA
jgi:alkanesulfonate monooxygenase SsuD/methylene tetrahydromethanopterin reductase-like flavin-dependent oxidoreductase (luciferase family)